MEVTVKENEAKLMGVKTQEKATNHSISYSDFSDAEIYVVPVDWIDENGEGSSMFTG